MSLATIPLIIGDELIGALNLMAEGPDAFAEDHLEVVREVADQLAIATRQADLHEQIQRQAVELEARVSERTAELETTNRKLHKEIAERKQVEETLRESEEKYRNVVENATEGIIVIQDGERKFFNPKWPEILGYTPEEYAELPGFAPVHPDDQERVRGMYKRRLGGETLPESSQFRLLNKSGNTRWAEGRGAAITWEGKPAHLSILLDITERKQIEAAEREKTRELAAAEERQRLARDLHDAVTQTLWSTSLIADVLPELWEQDRDKGHERLQRLRQLTRGALAEMRTLVYELRPAVLLETPLAELLDRLVDATRSRTRAEVNANVQHENEPLPEVRLALYRIAQEALNNAVRHADATHIEVQLRSQVDWATLEISDNGCGFNFEEAVSGGHLGLSTMRERADEIGASLIVVSEPGHGTQITVNWAKSAETEKPGE